LVSVPGLSFLGASESFLCTTFEAKMPKGPVIQDTSILGKGRNLSMKVFLDVLNSLIQATERGARRKKTSTEEGNPFTQVSW